MDINCPYCDAELNINHDDGNGYTEDEIHEMQCKECEKNFVFGTSIIYHYSPHKADCLNGEDHKYELTHTSPKAFSKMRCEDCEEERELTEKERIKFEIPTREEYFEDLKDSKDSWI